MNCFDYDLFDKNITLTTFNLLLMTKTHSGILYLPRSCEMTRHCEECGIDIC